LVSSPLKQTIHSKRVDGLIFSAPIAITDYSIIQGSECGMIIKATRNGKSMDAVLHIYIEIGVLFLS